RQVVRRGHGAVPGAGHSASRCTYAMRISSIRSRRSRTVQSAVLTGGSTVTSTVPGLSVVELRPATESEFLITIGTTGRPVAIAIRKAPFLNGPTDWVAGRARNVAVPFLTRAAGRGDRRGPRGRAHDRQPLAPPLLDGRQRGHRRG